MPKLRQPKEKQEDLKLEDQLQDDQTLETQGGGSDDQGDLQQEDAAVALQTQLDALRKSEEAQRFRADNAVRDREEAIRRAREREVEVNKFQKEAVDSQYDAISSAIVAANSEAEKAQIDIENAIAIGDSKAQADAYRRLARAESNLGKLEDGKIEIEARRKEEPKALASQVEDPIDKSGLPDTAKNWLRTHPEYMTDARKNSKIQSLHWDVVDEGHAAFSPAYFESLETHLNMRQAPQQREARQENQQQERASIMSAPVSREVPTGSGQPRPGQIRLTQDQRAAAKLAGVTEKVYAENLQKLNDMKANGTYGDRQ